MTARLTLWARFAAVFIAARLLLRARRFWQIDQTGVAIANKAASIGLIAVALIVPFGAVVIAVIAVAAIAVAVAVAVLRRRLTLLALLLLGGHLALRFGQHAGVMLGMLREILSRDAVV